MGFVRSAILVMAVLAIAVSFSIGASAQIPPPKQEAELVAAGYKRLSGQEISTLALGNTQYVVFLNSEDGARPGDIIKIYYPNARTRIVIPPRGEMAGKKVELNWWMDGNLQCVENKFVNVGHVCYSYYDAGSAYYACLQPDRRCFYLVRFVRGNPENI